MRVLEVARVCERCRIRRGGPRHGIMTRVVCRRVGAHHGPFKPAGRLRRRTSSMYGVGGDLGPCAGSQCRTGIMRRMPPKKLDTALAIVSSPRRLQVAVTQRVGKGYRSLLRRRARRQLAARVPDGASVHLGCGSNHWPGWLNVDLSRSAKPDLMHDLRAGFPLPPGRIERVYSEHVFEHLELEDACRVFEDVRVGLMPSSGVMRIAMPDLDAVIDHYGSDRWDDQSWLRDPVYDYIDSPARMLNTALRAWGHKYLYGYPELELRLREAGFTRISRVAQGESDWSDLRGLETRPDSLLVVEARP